MESLRHRWKRTHPHVRKPIVLVLGALFVLAAAATGWLPGPGGIPLFLIGIAILATEFVWAERFRDRILQWIHIAGKWLKAHKVQGALLIALGISFTGTIFYLLYIK